MINVISIDMDYIMEPCINLYNDKVLSGNVQRLWDELEKDMQINRHLSINNDNLKFLNDTFDFCIDNIKDKNNIFFAKNHDSILNILSLPQYKNETFNIINIDHHHDIAYSTQQMKLVDKYNVATVGSWMWYLDKYKKVNKYIWIKNWNSKQYNMVKANFDFKEIIQPSSIKQANGSENISIDLVSITLSPNWFPKQYYSIFADLRKKYYKLTGIYKPLDKEPYNIREESRVFPH